MKIKDIKLLSVWRIFFIASAALILFQGVWLYSTYVLKLNEIQNLTNNILSEAVQIELDKRFFYFNSMGLFMENNPDTLSFEENNFENNGVMSQQYFFTQKIMLKQNCPFNLTTLDSIYGSLLKKNHIDTEYQLYYMDSVRIIKSIGNLYFQRSNNSSVVPIVDGTNVKATINISPPIIFKQMFWMLVASALMLILIVACLVYELKMIFTQRRLNLLREDFTNALTHDMKTPLGTIYMAVDQWGKGTLDLNPELRSKFCEISREQVLNLQALVDKILTIASMEKGKLLLERKIVDLPEMINDLINKFVVQCGKSIEFSVNIDLKNTIICVDHTFVKNALSNLIDNAIKYSGDTVKIDISCMSGEKQLLIKVKDNGFGISQRDQLLIFEKFERGAALKRKGVKGFGLGLNYVKHVTEAHGGTIAVSSLEGVGSEFIIVIPIAFTSI